MVKRSSYLYSVRYEMSHSPFNLAFGDEFYPSPFIMVWGHDGFGPRPIIMSSYYEKNSKGKCWKIFLPIFNDVESSFNFEIWKYDVWMNWYQHYQTLLLGPRHLINDEGFRNALYLFDIGQNDLADSFSKNLSYAQVVKRIPFILAEIKYAIQVSSVILIRLLGNT